MKIRLIKEPDENELKLAKITKVVPDTTRIEMTFEDESLNDILANFKNFLSACGFGINCGDEIELIKEGEE